MSVSEPTGRAAAAPSAAVSPEGQRRQVTVLFADMVGYTATAEKLGEEATFALMSRLIGRLTETVNAYDGTVQTLTGDGMMVLFGAPVAIEDGPLKACRAALEIQRNLGDLAPEIEAAHGVIPQFRIGIHTGPLVVGRVGDDDKAEITALGDTVNFAARLEAEAEPGGIAMSEATHRLVGGFVDSTFAGERAIKGKSQKQPLYLLTGLKDTVSRFDVAVSRGLTPLVGRDRELERLEAAWEEAQAGSLRMVDIIGEAGIGKSRLIHDFRKRIEHDQVFFLQGRCTSLGTTTPFFPLIDVVRTSFRMSDGSGRTEAERRLRRGLETLGINVAETLPYLLYLLGFPVEDERIRTLDSEVVGVRTRDALLALLRERCRLSPTVLFFDDLHWMDHASEDVLARVSDGDDETRLLLICAYRPGYDAPWRERERATKIVLRHLSPSGTLDLLKSQLGTDEVPPELAHLAAERAEGNPLFVEEITNYLLSSGAVEKGERGVTYRADETGAMPVTLENLLMDRFDRLAAEPRALLEVAAVTGPRFSPHLLEAAWNRAGTADHLAELEEQGLILHDGDGYRFKHVLVREAIYDSLLGPKRERLHEQVAAAIEQEAGGERADILAHHYARTADVSKGVHYAALAGEKALLVYSLDEAEALLRSATDRIEGAPGVLDDSILVDILLQLCRVLYFRTAFYDIIALVERYMPVVERLGDQHRFARFLFEAGYAHVFAAQHKTGKPLLERALAIGEANDDRQIIGYASIGLMWHHIAWEAPSSDNTAEIQRLHDTGYRLGTELRDGWLASKCILGLVIYGSMTGRSSESRRAALRLLQFARETNDPRPRAMGLWGLSILNGIYFNYEEAIANADEAIASGLSPIDRSSALGGKGIALVNLGRIEEGRALLEDVRAHLIDKGMMLALTAIEYAYGLSMVLSGEMARGVRWIEESMQRLAGWGAVASPALGHLHLGEIFLRMADGSERPPGAVMLRNAGFLLRHMPFALNRSQRHFAEAADCFRSYDMPALLSWSLWGLGRVHIARKRYVEARTCLDEARTIATSVEEPALVDRVDEALTALPNN